jgi:formamidopyrimidine-DNA glycosylase
MVGPLLNILQPSGEPATIKFITVGGRTSAYVEEIQHLSPKTATSKDVAAVAADGDESDLTQPSEDDTSDVKTGGKRKKVRVH